MPDSLANRIALTLQGMNELYHHLLLVVGPGGSGKTAALRSVAERAGPKVINVNLALSRRMLGLTERQRALRLPSLLGDIVAEQEGETIFLDNTEVLFDVALRQDPLRLLQGLSRNRYIVATWSGHAEEDHLTYADPEHAEYRRYSTKDLLIVTNALT